MPHLDDLPTDPVLIQDVTDLANEDAWATFLGRYRPHILAWCRHWLPPDDAEEVTQEVLVRLVQEIPRHIHDPDRGRFRGWLYTVVKHQVVDHVRKQRRRAGAGDGTGSRLPLVPDPASVRSLVTDLDSRIGPKLELARQIAAVVERRGKPQTWEVFFRVQVLDQAPREVAQDLRIPLATVYVALGRVKRRIEQERRKHEVPTTGTGG